MEHVRDLYRKRFHSDPLADANLVINLSDNAKTFLSWSAVSGALPTFRTNSKRFFFVSRQQWMTPKDRLAALGLPVTPQAALAMGVPILPAPGQFQLDILVVSLVFFLKPKD